MASILGLLPCLSALIAVSGNPGDIMSMLQLGSALPVEQSAQGSRHSNHFCHGGDSMLTWVKSAPMREQTCLFKNVCFDPAKQEFLYFASGQGHTLHDLYRDNKLADNGLANGTISMNLRPHGQWPFQYMEGVPLNITVVDGSLPDKAKMFGAAVSVLFQPVGSENFGHQIGDDMFAVYQMMRLHHVQDPYQSQVLTLKDCDEYNLNYNKLHPTVINRTGCKNLIAKLYPAISAHSIESLIPKDGSSIVPNDSLVCFPNLIAGAGPLGIMGPRREGRSEMLWSYRNYMLTNLAVKASSNLSRIILSRKGSSVHPENSLHIENSEELALELKARLPSHEVTIVDFATMSLRDQAQLLSDTVALISHPGGGSFIGLFLPPGATMIVTTSPNGEKFHPENEPSLWSNLYWIQARWVPGNIVDPDILVPLVNDAVMHASEFKDYPLMW